MEVPPLEDNPYKGSPEPSIPWEPAKCPIQATKSEVNIFKRPSPIKKRGFGYNGKHVRSITLPNSAFDLICREKLLAKFEEGKK